ncbi:hypothetical protein QBC34DRAFT_390948 [Podospora aff. communis PSN243]|uniref:Uncharacterized protein n=1 Tax=Podospora aff. communis PSN243 TaxID=3040156 RepID=A0AAV9H739_9PEZI|nr:hypothetical protein QBC34DRAFT_390948 [Podospora aff. communis PSN243]
MIFLFFLIFSSPSTLHQTIKPLPFNTSNPHQPHPVFNRFPQSNQPLLAELQLQATTSKNPTQNTSSASPLQKPTPPAPQHDKLHIPASSNSAPPSSPSSRPSSPQSSASPSSPRPPAPAAPPRDAPSTTCLASSPPAGG